jgi:hypothetical protein
MYKTVDWSQATKNYDDCSAGQGRGYDKLGEGGRGFKKHPDREQQRLLCFVRSMCCGTIRSKNKKVGIFS